MQEFKYYKRGKGELDTSNFPDIRRKGKVMVSNLDEKTYMSLSALQNYLETTNDIICVTVVVMGYVAHMRSDKDVFATSRLYDKLTRLQFHCRSIQHESTESIKSAVISTASLIKDLPECSMWYTTFIGADGSVPKFCPEIKHTALKVREDGKVTDLEFDTSVVPEECDVVIVDDILGAGATVQKLVNTLKKNNFKDEIHLWVRYNEGIHTQEFLDQFKSYYLGDEI